MSVWNLPIPCIQPSQSFGNFRLGEATGSPPRRGFLEHYLVKSQSNSVIYCTLLAQANGFASSLKGVLLGKRGDNTYISHQFRTSDEHLQCVTRQHLLQPLYGTYSNKNWAMIIPFWLWYLKSQVWVRIGFSNQLWDNCLMGEFTYRFWMATHIIENVTCIVSAFVYGRYIAVTCRIPTLVSQKLLLL